MYAGVFNEPLFLVLHKQNVGTALPHLIAKLITQEVVDLVTTLISCDEI